MKRGVLLIAFLVSMASTAFSAGGIALIDTITLSTYGQGFGAWIVDGNGDGKSEIALIAGNSLYLIDENKNVVASHTFAEAARALAFHDIDKDGAVEFVVGTSNGDSGGYLYVGGFAGTDWVTEGKSERLYSIRYPDELAVEDFDNDGDAEIAVGISWYDRDLRVYDYSAGVFAQKWYYGIGSDVNFLDAGDTNGDGLAELAVGTQCWSDFQGHVYSNGVEIFQTGILGRTHVSFGDIDGDGYDELVTTAGGFCGGSYSVTMTLSVWNSDGGPFQLIFQSAPVSGYEAEIRSRAFDIDGDGADEIISLKTDHEGGAHTEDFHVYKYVDGQMQTVFDGPVFAGEVMATIRGGRFGDRSVFLVSTNAAVRIYGDPPSDGDSDGVMDDGDNCPSEPNADQADFEADGMGDVCDPDDDNDSALDAVDNCPILSNADQLNNDNDLLGDACDNDNDNDGVANAQDNCEFVANAGQGDLDADGLGDACDVDPDGDGVLANDNCPFHPNPDQTDTDADAEGDACDADDDNDGVVDEADNCPTVVNSAQADFDADSIGDACDIDIDGDGVENGLDICPLIANVGQDDTDSDTVGDACDDDDDNDATPDAADNCALIANPDQADSDADGRGNACDEDLDGDGVANVSDNCPAVANASQTDSDGDLAGDACDVDIDGDGVLNGADQCAFTALGAVLDPTNGCSIAQLVPCDGPRGTSVPWKNHGAYVSSMAQALNKFLAAGLITEEEKDALMEMAAGSACGAK